MFTCELGIWILFLEVCREDLAFRQDLSHSGVDIFSRLSEASPTVSHFTSWIREVRGSCSDVLMQKHLQNPPLRQRNAESTYKIRKINSALIAHQLPWEKEFYLKRQ